MRNDILGSVVEDMFTIPSLVHRIARRKLFKVTTNIREDISPPLFVIMRVLEEAGTLHIAEIGGKLQIPKPQMTHLIDKLVKMEMVTRQTDATDRRIINVLLTRNGKKALAELKKAVKSSIRMDLSCLTDEELAELMFSLRKLKNIFSKLQ